MPYKDPERQKQAQREHYLRNKDRYKRKAVNWKYAHYTHATRRRKNYDRLPELAPTKEQKLIEGGLETSKTLSEKYGVPQRQIRRACKEKEISCVKIGQEYFISNTLQAEEWCTWSKFYDTVLSKRPLSLRSIPSWFHINDIEVDIPNYNLAEVLNEHHQ